jgi:hypothetical protein
MVLLEMQSWRLEFFCWPLTSGLWSRYPARFLLATATVRKLLQIEAL